MNNCCAVEGYDGISTLGTDSEKYDTISKVGTEECEVRRWRHRQFRVPIGDRYRRGREKEVERG